MIWHIFRKDCNALARGIYAVALLNAISTAMLIAVGPFDRSQWYISSLAMSVIALSSMLLLTAAAVMQDAPSINEQDWRVRPIRRRDLIAAKLLFAILAVHGPLLVLDFVGGVAQGFGALPTASAALARGGALFLSLTLPAMVLATLARDLGAWLRAIIGVAVLLILFGAAIERLMPWRPHYSGTGLGWIPTFVTLILVVVAACSILPLRYHSPRRGSPLVIGVGAIVLSVFATVLPWDLSFAIQRAFASAPMPDAAATFSFDPFAKRSRPSLRSMDIMWFAVPLRIANIPSHGMLLIENAALRITDERGAVIYAGNTNCVRGSPLSGAECTAANFPVRAPDNSHTASVYYPVGLPGHVYDRVRHEPMRIELEYYVSLLVVDDVDRVGAEGLQTPWCALRRHGDWIERRCLGTAPVSACTRILGQYHPFWKMVPQVERCRPDYAPLRFNRLPDVVRRFDNTEVLYPRAGRSALQGTVGQAGNLIWDEEYVALETYRARSHFKRTVRIDNVRVAYWGN
jgi:hypothetical protein